MGVYVEKINSFVWGVPALLLILGVGLFLSFRTGFAQFTMFPKAVGTFLSKFRSKEKNETSAYQALCTALAATVGTGNLAGVAGAIAIGGPGAVFWMWICAFLGMVTKYAEATLAVRYSVLNSRSERVGGPMYMIKSAFEHRWHWLASLYCYFGVVAAFGVGNATQINTLISGINRVIHIFGGNETRSGNLVMGLLLAVLIAQLLLGGARRIGLIAERLVPFAAILYLLMGIGVLILKAPDIPNAFASIIRGAFSPGAVTGGVLGSAFTALRVGASRGVFTNEAGMGTAAIAHASAKVDHPVEQGMMGIIEVFIDTILICTMTALVILCSKTPIAYGVDEGIALTNRAFSAVYGDWSCIPIAIVLCSLALATILGWGLYGARCAQYLFGENAWRPFVFLQIAAVVAGAILKTGTVWLLSEVVNGLMAIPNLLVLAKLSSEIKHLTNEYKNRTKRSFTLGGTYEDFNQCQSL